MTAIEMMATTTPEMRKAAEEHVWNFREACDDPACLADDATVTVRVALEDGRVYTKVVDAPAGCGSENDWYDWTAGAYTAHTPSDWETLDL